MSAGRIRLVSKIPADASGIATAICSRTLVGSEAAMSGHIDDCLTRSEKRSKKKQSKVSKPTAGKARPAAWPSSKAKPAAHVGGTSKARGGSSI